MNFITRAGHKATVELRPTDEAIFFDVRVEGYTSADAPDIAAAVTWLRVQQFPDDPRPTRFDLSRADRAQALLDIARRAEAASPQSRRERRLRQKIMNQAISAAHDVLGSRSNNAGVSSDLKG